MSKYIAIWVFNGRVYYVDTIAIARYEMIKKIKQFEQEHPRVPFDASFQLVKQDN